MAVDGIFGEQPTAGVTHLGGEGFDHRDVSFSILYFERKIRGAELAEIERPLKVGHDNTIYRVLAEQERRG